jgi:hypothetical protein
MTASVPWMMDGSALREDGLIADEADCAATNKFLAQSNKSRRAGKATKEQRQQRAGSKLFLG